MKWKAKDKEREIGFIPKGQLKNMEISIFMSSGYRWCQSIVMSRALLMTLVIESSLREWGLKREMSMPLSESTNLLGDLITF